MSDKRTVIDSTPLLGAASDAPVKSADAASAAQFAKDNAPLTGKHAVIFIAAWLGWGFDFFDLLLFANVARACISDLLSLHSGDSDFQSTIDFWTGLMSSLSLIGWGFGGIVFGFVADRFGRSKTLLITVLTYCLSTTLCAVVPNVWLLCIFRFMVGMGVGGEAGAGATLIAETFPERWRVFFSLMLFTAASVFSYLSTIISNAFTDPTTSLGQRSDSWRFVFLVGLVPALVTILLRLKVEEPEAWTNAVGNAAAGAAASSALLANGASDAPHVVHNSAPVVTAATSFRLLFAPKYIRRTISGVTVCTVTLVTFWVFGSFQIPISDQLAGNANSDNLAWWEDAVSLVLNGVGILVVFPMIPAFHRFKRMHILQFIFVGSTLSTFIILYIDWNPYVRLGLIGVLGTFIQAGFPCMPLYLPEAFPVHIRALAYGLCYNFGRFIAAGAVFIVAAVRKTHDSKGDLTRVVSWVAVVPLLGVIFLALGGGYETFDESIAGGGGLDRKEDVNAATAIGAGGVGGGVGTDSPVVSVHVQTKDGDRSVAGH